MLFGVFRSILSNSEATWAAKLIAPHGSVTKGFVFAEYRPQRSRTSGDLKVRVRDALMEQLTRGQPGIFLEEDCVLAPCPFCFFYCSFRAACELRSGSNGVVYSTEAIPQLLLSLQFPRRLKNVWLFSLGVVCYRVRATPIDQFGCESELCKFNVAVI